MGATIKAVTFDLWDTIIHDDSDESKRAALGLRSKKDERRHLVWEALRRVSPIDRASVERACDAADAAFDTAWHDQAITYPVGERIRQALQFLGRSLPPYELAAIVRAYEEMEITIQPDPVSGVADALAQLSRRYRLCVVSDTYVSPGRCLRRLLEAHDLTRYFSGFAFSDEVGRSKLHRAMFESAARQLGCEITEMIHVGDREHNDISGARTLGMKAVLFTGARGSDPLATAADAVCARHADLPAVIDRLAGRP
ncbi:MAG: HAD family hydrolase [Kiloniellales bacterium]